MKRPAVYNHSNWSAFARSYLVKTNSIHHQLVIDLFRNGNIDNKMTVFTCSTINEIHAIKKQKINEAFPVAKRHNSSI